MVNSYWRNSKASKILLIIPLLVIASGILFVGSANQKAVATRSQIAEAASEVGPAVARVEVTKTVETQVPEMFNDPFFRYFFGEPPKEEREVQGLGSGFAISWQGKKYVLTNQHVVTHAKEIRLVFPEDKTFKAQVIGGDEMMDVAVLEITKSLYGSEVEDLPVLELGDSSYTPVGAWLVAVGNPEGFQNTVTAGVLSAKNRTIPHPKGEGSYINMLQTDASINPGNSGGPLVNTEGEVIGINTLIIRQNRQGIPLTGLNFAISVDSVKKVLPELIKEEEVDRAWLGVYIQNLTARMSTKFGVAPGQGVLVAEVVQDSPADKAGIKAGDLITEVSGEDIENPSQLQEEIMYREVGARINITVKRGEGTKKVTVTLGKRTGQEKEDTNLNQYTAANYGLTLQENSPALTEKYDLSREKGLVVTEVTPGSRADGKLRKGDVILGVEHQTVNSIESWKKAVKALESSEPLLLRVVRDGVATFIII